jgi:ATP-binding cassette subfamily F protein uup
VVTSTIAWEGDAGPGLWREYEGGYEDWKTQRDRSRALRAAAAPKPAPAPAPAPSAAPKAAAPARKLSFKEQRELDELPARIEALEAEQKVIGERLSGSALYTEAPHEVAPLQARYAEIEEALMAALERWEALSARG